MQIHFDTDTETLRVSTRGTPTLVYYNVTRPVYIRREPDGNVYLRLRHLPHDHTLFVRGVLEVERAEDKTVIGIREVER